jgi:hypothetical protein
MPRPCSNLLKALVVVVGHKNEGYGGVAANIAKSVLKRQESEARLAELENAFMAMADQIVHTALEGSI